jgi:hypothetical protein
MNIFHIFLIKMFCGQKREIVKREQWVFEAENGLLIVLDIESLMFAITVEGGPRK